MVRSAIGLALWFMGPALVHAQTQGWAEKLFIQDGVPRVTHDFGTVPRGAILSYRFPIRNIYAVPMTILSTRTSCGCVSIATPQQVIPPLQSSTIDVSMDARRFVGAKTVSIYVTVGQPPKFHSTAVLTVSANSRQDVVFNPGEVNFGVVPRGQSPTQTIDVEYAGTLDWRIENVRTDAPLTVTSQESYRKPGGTGYKLAVTLNADAPPGPHRWDVILQTNDPTTPTVSLLVEATVQTALVFAPPQLTLRSPVGQEVTRRLFLRGSGQPFRVLRVEGEGDGLTVEPLSENLAVQVVTIRYTPTGKGTLRRQLVFHTDMEQQPTATLPIEAGGD
jgi:hypothetical protein